MSVAGIRKGDVVHCDVRGQCSYALVLETDASQGSRKGLRVDPIGLPGYGPTFVSAFQVTGHWRKSKASKV